MGKYVIGLIAAMVAINITEDVNRITLENKAFDAIEAVVKTHDLQIDSLNQQIKGKQVPEDTNVHNMLAVNEIAMQIEQGEHKPGRRVAVSRVKINNAFTIKDLKLFISPISPGEFRLKFPYGINPTVQFEEHLKNKLVAYYNAHNEEGK